VYVSVCVCVCKPWGMFTHSHRVYISQRKAEGSVIYVQMDEQELEARSVVPAVTPTSI